MFKKVPLWVFIVLFLGLSYFAISPLFRNVEVQDELPENLVVESEDTVSVPSGFEDLSPEKQAEMLRQIKEANEISAPANDDATPGDSAGVTTQETTFPVMGTLGHLASGQVRIIETTTGTVVRYEDFSTINGPKLHVYLAKDLKAKDFIDLGVIKGTSGNINYEVPEGVDISEYKYVIHWCTPFRVLFNYAEIN